MDHMLGVAVPEDRAALAAALQDLRTKPLADLREQNLQRTKQQLRESVTPDLIIINTINTIEELDKVANALVKRLREWYALYNPELEHQYPDHHAFIEAALHNSTRSADTMGGLFKEQELGTILSQAALASQIYAQREVLIASLEAAMEQHTPNIKRLAGATIGAKLIAMSGSLLRMSRLPSSTIQLLGAETALFRHLRNKRARPPKHGIIFNHQLLQRAPREMRGKVARALADKLSIAAKVDYFKGEFIGEQLYREVEAKAGVKA